VLSLGKHRRSIRPFTTVTARCHAISVRVLFHGSSRTLGGSMSNRLYAAVVSIPLLLAAPVAASAGLGSGSRPKGKPPSHVPVRSSAGGTTAKRSRLTRGRPDDHLAACPPNPRLRGDPVRLRPGMGLRIGASRARRVRSGRVARGMSAPRRARPVRSHERSRRDRSERSRSPSSGNEGQTAAGVQYLSRGRGYVLYLTPTDAVLALHRAVTPGRSACGKAEPAPGRERAGRRSACGLSEQTVSRT
jgi:hypothetical protein